MRKISVSVSGAVSVEGEIDYSGKSKPREHSKVTINITNISCSCSEKLLNSYYVNNRLTDVGILGQPQSVFDHIIEDVFFLMVDEETIQVELFIKKKYIDDGLDKDVLFTCNTYLKIVENGKAIYELTPREKVDIALKYKGFGVEMYKEGNFKKQVLAFHMFSKAIKMLSLISPKETECSQDEVKAVKAHLYNNLALYHLQRRHYDLAVCAASRVIDVYSDNVKALYRRAVANTEMQNYELAESDIQRALSIDPANGPIRKHQEEVKRRKKVVSEKFAHAMKKYFA